MRRIIFTTTLAVSVLAACATTRTTQAQLDDQATTRRVRIELMQNDEIRGGDIDVDTIDGVVYLRGTVVEPEDRLAATLAARGVEGVEFVDNQLQVANDSDVADGNPDAWITTLIETKLAANTDTKSRNIDVDTEDRVVTLSGVVENLQAKRRAVQLAYQVEGVRWVDDQLAVATTTK